MCCVLLFFLYFEHTLLQSLFPAQVIPEDCMTTFQVVCNSFYWGAEELAYYLCFFWKTKQ